MTRLDVPVSTAAFVPFPHVSQETGPAVVDPVRIDVERPDDADARESLLDRAFGPARFRKTCQMLRAGRHPARGLSLVARAHALGGGGPLIGTVRLWHVEAGGVPALMLGPLAVDARYRCFGVGALLMTEAVTRAKALGYDAILLVGDAPYYQRFGFERRHTRGLRMPGPVEDARFLGLELTPGVRVRQGSGEADRRARPRGTPGAAQAEVATGGLSGLSHACHLHPSPEDAKRPQNAFSRLREKGPRRSRVG